MPIGFDVESASEYVEGIKLSDLGISCAALWEGVPIFFTASDPFGFYKDEMSADNAQDLADYIIAKVEEGEHVVTWNGTSFDVPLLAAICDDPAYEEKLKWATLNHIDIGLNMAMEKGFMIGLNTATHALALSGKTEGMTGSLAPILWKGVDRELTAEEQQAISALGVEPRSDEARDLCLEYVGNDAKITVDVYDGLKGARRLTWITKNGTLSRRPWFPLLVDGEFPLVKYWLDKDQPDIGWDDNPFIKSDIMRWVL